MGLDRLSESRYTAPSQWCPNPERWHSHNSNATEIEVTMLLAALVGALRPDVVLETGTNTGQTALAIGEVMRHSGIGHLHTLENNVSVAEAARRSVDGLPVTVHCVNSLEFPVPPRIDFAFFDSLEHLRAQEFLRFWPAMEAGNLVAFHDSAPHKRSVLASVEQLERDGWLHFLNLRTPRGLILAEVLRARRASRPVPSWRRGRP